MTRKRLIGLLLSGCLVLDSLSAMAWAARSPGPRLAAGPTRTSIEALSAVLVGAWKQAGHPAETAVRKAVKSLRQRSLFPEGVPWQEFITREFKSGLGFLLLIQPAIAVINFFNKGVLDRVGDPAFAMILQWWPAALMAFFWRSPPGKSLSQRWTAREWSWVASLIGFGAANQWLYFQAFARLPPVTANIIVNLTPLLLFAAGAVYFHERRHLGRRLAVFAGFWAAAALQVAGGLTAGSIAPSGAGAIGIGYGVAAAVFSALWYAGQKKWVVDKHQPLDPVRLTKAAVWANAAYAGLWWGWRHAGNWHEIAAQAAAVAYWVFPAYFAIGYFLIFYRYARSTAIMQNTDLTRTSGSHYFGHATHAFINGLGPVALGLFGASAWMPRESMGLLGLASVMVAVAASAAAVLDADKPNLARLMRERRHQGEYVRKTWKTQGAPIIAVVGSARILDLSHPAQKQGERLGAFLREAGLIVRTGAGLAIMEAVIRGWLRRNVELGDDLPRPEFLPQGVRILLDFEAEQTPYLEKGRIVHVHHFAIRKLLLLLLGISGGIAQIGGFGTQDEVAEMAGKRKPVVLLEPPEPHGPFWRPQMDALFSAWDRFGLAAGANERPWVTRSEEDAVRYVHEHSHEQNGRPPLNAEDANQELDMTLRVMGSWKPAITFIGHPHPEAPELGFARDLAREIVGAGREVRIASRGPLFDTLASDPLVAKHLQSVLYIPPGYPPTPNEWRQHSLRPPVLAADDTNQQMAMSKGSAGFVIFPGKWGTLRRALDILTIIQTRKRKAAPMFFYPPGFWADYLAAVVGNALQFDPPLISPGDGDLLRIGGRMEDAFEVLGFNRSRGAASAPAAAFPPPMRRVRMAG